MVQQPREPGYDPTPLILIVVLGALILGCMYLYYDYYQKAGSPLVDRPRRKIGEYSVHPDDQCIADGPDAVMHACVSGT